MTFNEVILGTSVFCYAPQFGHRSRLYELDFQKQPVNIEKILNHVYDMNVSEIMLRNSDDLIKALEMSIDSGHNWDVVGFTHPDNFEDDMALFSRFNTKTVMIDGFYVDEKVKEDKIEDVIGYLKKIKDAGYIPAIETRMPYAHLEKIANSDLFDFFDVIMMPLNFYGYMMDCNFMTNDNKEKINDLAKLYYDKRVIANRTLAAGVLTPVEAYDFIAQVDFISAVCVGMAKPSEVDETMSIINKVRETGD